MEDNHVIIVGERRQCLPDQVLISDIPLMNGDVVYKRADIPEFATQRRPDERVDVLTIINESFSEM
jgi:hypothetical protein